MSEVKKYDCTNGKAQHCYGCYQMTESAQGDYVSSADFDRVSAENLALQQRLTVQDQRVDELERDAARYRWLRDVSVGPHMIDRLLFQTVSDDCNPPYRDMKHGVELDVAIDAAIKPTAEAVSHE